MAIPRSKGTDLIVNGGFWIIVSVLLMKTITFHINMKSMIVMRAFVMVKCPHQAISFNLGIYK